MKAVIVTDYGAPQVLQVQDIDKPVPKDNEVLVKLKATSVNFGDLMARNFKDVTPSNFNMPLLFWFFAKIFFGFGKPKVKILGSEFAGEIESTGKNVTTFKPGDSVFGYLGQNMGSYAEYFCMPESGCLTHKPSNMTEPAAAVTAYGAIMAVNLLRKANIQPGQKVLINGASGSMGSAAVQIAKSYGADVTGVCGKPRMEFVKSLGADRVIDYRSQDFTEGPEKYDLVFDVLGKSSFSKVKRVLTDNGINLRASFKSRQLLQMLWTSVTGGKKIICALAPGSKTDLVVVKELIEQGKIKTKPYRVFPLEQAADAHQYVEEGNHQGPVALIIS